MVIYNVTLKVDHSVVEEWLHWMHEEHIPEMFNFSLFQAHSFNKLMEQDESDGFTFVVQYYCPDMAAYKTYLEQHAQSMRQKGIDKFGDKVLGFRTIMEVLSQSNFHF